MLEKLLPYKNPMALFFYGAREVPIRIAGATNQGIFKDLINFTMTHRMDSDIQYPYGFIVPKDPGARLFVMFFFKCQLPTTACLLELKKDFRPSFMSWLPFHQSTQSTQSTQSIQELSLMEKQNDIIFIASNCATPSNRANYVGAMKKLTKLKIDTYGKCGKNKLSRDPKIFSDVLKTYKFYLSFENSICRGYITEKFFQVMEEPIIPVVRGSRLRYLFFFNPAEPQGIT